HHREGVGEFGCFLLQRLSRPLAGKEDALGVLQGDRAQQFLFLFCPFHHWPPRISAARVVPSTRARIFSNAVSRVVVVSSQKGENPQSSVVPIRWTGRYWAGSGGGSRPPA